MRRALITSIAWYVRKPDGQPCRCLDTSQASELLGSEAEVGLKEEGTRTIEQHQRPGPHPDADPDVFASAS
jgi:hypothetical protein